MLRIIAQKYPAPSPKGRSVLVSILFGLFITLFLLFFEPFDINLSTNKNKVFHLFLFGVITTVVLLVFLYVLPLCLPKIFSDKQWTVKHQILFYIIILLVIATCNGLYTNYSNSLPFTWYNYGWIISRTFVLGGIPISFLTLLDYQRKANYYKEQANSIPNTTKEFTKHSEEHIHEITTDLKYETISFLEDDFLFAKAVGNYIDLFTSVDETVKKESYRVTLSSFEKQTKQSSGLVRCHRSYVVNLKKVKSISGNAQGLRLEMQDESEIVPVSRKYIPMVRIFFSEKSIIKLSNIHRY